MPCHRSGAPGLESQFSPGDLREYLTVPGLNTSGEHSQRHEAQKL